MTSEVNSGVNGRMTDKIISRSTHQTEEAGRSLAAELLCSGRRRAFVAMYGDMGVGKTAFTRGFVSTICNAAVRSPTYTVVNEYRGGEIPIFHFDMYRIEGEDDLYSVGFYDYLSTDGYCICEWSENIESEIPKDAISVVISRTEDENERKITIERVS